MAVLAVGVVVIYSVPLLAQCKQLCPLEYGQCGRALLWMSGELGANHQPELNDLTSCGPRDPSPRTQPYTGAQR